MTEPSPQGVAVRGPNRHAFVVDQREWDYGARLPRDRRAAESWSLETGPESTESGENPPKWQSITDTGSLEPSAEALAWAQRADQWAQQPANLPERAPGQSEGQVSRWSEVVPTGNLPADGVGWRTETAEWRATSARWRQTTEWRSSSGTHGWRSTTEAWQTGDANVEGFPPPGAPPTGGPLAISGTAYSGESSYDQAAPESYQPTDGSYQTESYTPPGQQPTDSRPGWQQFTTPAAPWQQPAPTPPWQQPGAAAAWQQGAPPWEQPRPWQQLVGPDDGRHLVREDDRAQWRQSAALGENGQVGRRRAPESGQAGTGWSTRSEGDDWAGHNDTGGMPLFPEQTPTGAGWQDRAAPSWAASEAPDWRSRSDSQDQDLPGRRTPEQPTDWRSETGTTTPWRTGGATPSWQTDRPAEGARGWQPDGRAAGEAPSWQTDGRPAGDTPGYQANGRPAANGSDWRGDARSPADAPDWRTDSRSAGDAPDWRADGRTPGYQADRDPASDTPAWESNGRPAGDAPGWRGDGRPTGDRPGWQAAGEAPDWRADQREAPDWRTERRPGEQAAPGRRADGRPSDDGTGWRDDDEGPAGGSWGRRPAADATDWRDDDEGPPAGSWGRRPRPSDGRDGRTGNGSATADAPDWRTQTGTSSWRDEAPAGRGRREEPEADWRSQTGISYREDAPESRRREPDSGSWSRGEDPRADGWRPAPEQEAQSWRRDEDWRREGTAADPWAPNAADTGVIPASYQPPATDTGSWRAPAIEPPRRERYADDFDRYPVDPREAETRRVDPYAPRRGEVEPYSPERWEERDPYGRRSEVEPYVPRERDPYGRRPEVERFDDPYGRRAEIEAGPRRRAQIEPPEDDWEDDEDEDDVPPPGSPVSPEVWQRGDDPRPERSNWRMEPLDDARTQSWRRELQQEQGLVGEAATEIRPLADWQQADREATGNGSASYRENHTGNTGDWRRELAAESDLADGESRRFGTADFAPFESSAAVPAPVAAARLDQASPSTSGRWQDPPDTQWPPRPVTGYDAASTGSYERRPVSTLPTASGRQNNLLEPDEDEIEESTGGPLAAVGYTVIWYGVPVVLFVFYMLVLNGSQQAHALSTLAGAAPQFGLSLVLSMLVAVGLRWASGSWKAASVGLAAAVVGGGLATVLTSAITGNSLS